jgi:hypothetical protein
LREKGWTMPVELLEVRQERDSGFTLAVFHFQQKLPDEKTYYLDSYFTLIFHKEDGLWKVVADICTPIKKYTE